MWLSRKINSIIKQQQPQQQRHTTILNQSHYKRKQQHISFVLAIVTSSSTHDDNLIQYLGLEEVEYSSATTHHHNRKLYRLVNNENFIIQMIQYNEMSSFLATKLELLDGAIVFLDTNSTTTTNDITNGILSQQIPCLLIGLVSSQKEKNKERMNIIQLDIQSPNDIKLLKKHFIQLIYTDRRALINQQKQQITSYQQQQDQINNSVITTVEDTTPTTTTTVVTRKKNENTYNLLRLPVSAEMSYSNSSGSSSNGGGGETISDIMDQLLHNHHDENSFTIFLTVYRKFMKPSDLVNMLIQRFEESEEALTTTINQEQHETSSSPFPNSAIVTSSSIQQRIQSILHVWLSNYWGDFTNSTTRQILFKFLHDGQQDDLILLMEGHREPHDKDACWAMSDEAELETEEFKQSRKKDSGYCETYGDCWQNNTGVTKKKKSSSMIPPSITNDNNNKKGSIRRAVSTNTLPHSRIPSTSRLPPLPPIHYHHKHQEQQQGSMRRNSTPVITTTPTTKRSHSSLPPYHCSAVFGGGMISIIHQDYLFIDPFEIITTTSAFYLASQLTWIEMEIFSKIQPRDFLRHLYTQKKHHQQQNTTTIKNPVIASIEHFNFVSGWIASLVVNQVILEKRIIVFEYCLCIAVELRKLNNYNTLMSVLAGLNSAAVLRLKLTRESTKRKNPKLYHQYLELELLMSSERSFCNYRSALKQTQLPGIPYLGIHQQDLVSLGEANKDHKMDGKVHWKKFSLMGECILDMIRFQQSIYYPLEPNPFLLYFIGHDSLSSTEDDRYEKSIEIEPRNMTLKPSLSTKSTTSSSRWLMSYLNN